VTEKKPVYSVPVDRSENTNDDARTHEYEDSISAFSPALDHLIVFFLCNIRIHGEERPRAITELGVLIRFLGQLRLILIIVFIYTRVRKISEDKSKRRLTHT
jgi:hypothetical protein